MSAEVEVAEVVARLRAAGCVFAEDEARLLADAASNRAELDGLVRRRVAGLPLEHLLGWALFCGLRIDVAPGVFVPRRRTGFLVERACCLVRAGSVVVDLCCGSGAIAAALAAATAGVGGVELHATDVDPVAVRCARRNLAGTSAVVHEGDLDAALPETVRGRVDVLVANVPYVPTDAVALMPPEARLHEARVALDGGRDGLDVVRRLAGVAPRWLAPGGRLLFEVGAGQADWALRDLARVGLSASVHGCAERGATVVVAGMS